MKHLKLPSLEKLHDLFDYDPISGHLTDKLSGERVGWLNKQGYRQCRVGKKQYKVHRIVFYMYHRRDPGKKVIDHIDGDKDNNSIFNLRACSTKDNCRNTAQRRAKGTVPKAERGAHLAWA